MFTSGDSWTIAYQFNRNVDFCIWLLLQDGLRVAPFDQHPDGHASLRRAGLDGDAWLDWTRRVVTALTHRYSQHARSMGGMEALRAFARADRPPTEEWVGLQSVRAALDDMWQTSLADSSEGPIVPKADRELSISDWKQLDPVKQKIEELYVYYVSYPYPVLFLAPPTSILIGTTEGLLSAEAFLAMVRDGAFALAGLT